MNYPFSHYNNPGAKYFYCSYFEDEEIEAKKWGNWGKEMSNHMNKVILLMVDGVSIWITSGVLLEPILLSTTPHW